MQRQRKTGWEQLGIDPKKDPALANKILGEMDDARDVKGMVWLETGVGEKLPKPKSLGRKKRK
jgi:hypothetical protein